MKIGQTILILSKTWTKNSNYRLPQFAGLFLLALCLQSYNQGSGGIDIKTDPTVDDRVLWRQGDLHVTAKSAEFPFVGPSEKLYLLSFLPGSPIEKLALNSPALRSFHAGSAQSVAVVAINSEDELTYWAKHAHSGAGLACGNIQRIPFTATLAEDVTLSPPVYHSGVKIPEVDDLVSSAELVNFDAIVVTLANISSRYHSEQSGIDASTTVRQVFDSAGSGITGYESALVVHDGSDQSSVVAKIAGQTDTDKTVVIGCHLDSINTGDDGDAPGADDNASGVATLAEVLRIIKESGVKFDRNIEFHAYGAEEVGLIGSSEIAESYASEEKTVVSMLQVDMNTYSSNADDDTIYLVSTDTSASVRRVAKDVLNNYVGGSYIEKKLSAGTSDHKSWSVRGFPAVFPFEDPSDYNPHLHTSTDTGENAPNRVLPERFVKLILGFLAHYAGMELTTTNYDKLHAEFLGTLDHDLKLALIPSGFDGRYYVGVSAPSGISEVEVCVVNSEEENECVQERVLSPLAGNYQTRGLFIDDVSLLDLEADVKLRVMGYTDGALVAVRNVGLTDK
jgi:hypothetical protein